MNENRYLSGILKIVESKNGVRRLFYYQAAWVLFSILLLYGAAHFQVVSRSTAVLFIGLVSGIFVARAESIFNFRYLAGHINVESLKARLSNIRA